MYIDEEKRPEPVSATNFVVAVVLHALFFALLWFAGQMSFREKEVVIPIELTVVPFENLDGNEDEPPPVAPPEPAPPEPAPPEPAVEPEPPPVPDPPPEAVVETPREKEEEKKVEPPKPPEPPRPKEKTEEEKRREREERIKKMRESATDVKEKPKPKPPEPPRNGKTGPRTLSDAEIARLLSLGAKVGSYEQVSSNEEAISLGALKSAMDARWAQLAPQVGRDGDVEITIRFDASTRRIASCSLSRSSGDATTDAAAMNVVRSLGVVRGITSGFAKKYSGESITIRYHVKSSR